MRTHIRVAAPPAKPVLVYDGDCRFCQLCVARLRSTVGDRLEYLASQDPGLPQRFPELTTARLDLAVHLVDTDGAVSAGAESILEARALLPDHHWLLDWYDHSSRFAHTSEWLYAFVARHRRAFSRLVRIGWGRHFEVPRHFLVRIVFLKLVGVIFLAAFLSLWTQISGLVGSNGIVPAQVTMWLLDQQYTAMKVGLDRYHRVPSLAWWSASDRALNLFCATGVVLSGLLIAGIAPAPVLFLLWLIYLSLASICREFLGYQMDNLLLEVGFLSIFLAPLTRRLGSPGAAAPSRAVIWLLRWLLIRLTLFAAITKLANPEVAWRELSALEHFFETQPLPTWAGWQLALWPAGLLRALTWALLAIEIGAGLLILGPRRVRQFACICLAGLHGFLFVTGNHGFYHLLVLALCVVLLDDFALDSLRARLPKRWRAGRGDSPAGMEPVNVRRRVWPAQLIVPLCAIAIVLPLVQFSTVTRKRWPWPGPVKNLNTWMLPFRTFNIYNPFASVATNRYEIIIEGSVDGQTWQEYDFKAKPGHLSRPPRLVAPHHPRLDQVLWVGSNKRMHRTAWFENLCFRLLQGRPEVTALLRTNPFEARPPRFIRALLYEYRMVDRATRKATGAYWTRVPVREYLPPTTVDAMTSTRLEPPPSSPPAKPRAAPKPNTKPAPPPKKIQ